MLLDGFAPFGLQSNGTGPNIGTLLWWGWHSPTIGEINALHNQVGPNLASYAPQ
jgi:hypothetical protein